MDPRQDVITKAAQLVQEVASQVRGYEGERHQAACRLALGTWRAIATEESICRIVDRTIRLPALENVLVKLEASALVDFDRARDMPGYNRAVVRAAQNLIRMAVDEVLRHAKTEGPYSRANPHH